MKHGIKEKDVRDFVKCAKKLSDVMDRILKYNPDANAFLSCESERTLCLFGEDFHKMKKEEISENIVAEVDVTAIDGGGF